MLEAREQFIRVTDNSDSRTFMPVAIMLLQYTSIQWFERETCLNISHELHKITNKSFSASEQSIENNCSTKAGVQRWNILL